MIHRFIDLLGTPPIFAYQRAYFDGTNTYTQIWCLPLTSGTPAQVTTVTTDGTLDESPDVSPDGTKIAFTRQTSFSSPKLRVVNADGSGDTQLDSTVGATAPMWKPDGQKIVYRIGASIYHINPDGTGKTTLYTAGGTDTLAHPVYNSDGTKIAFHVDKSSALTVDELWVMNADGSSPTKLSDASRGGLGGLGISWANNSDVIAFVERISSNNHVSKINADGTGKTQLTSASIVPAMTKYAWSTDDSQIFVTKSSATPWTIQTIPPAGGGEAAVSPTLEGHQVVGAGMPFVYGERVYTIRRTTQDLVSIKFDGSDLRVEDTPNLVGPTFINLRLSGNGTEL